jgi:hypothetical protein
MCINTVGCALGGISHLMLEDVCLGVYCWPILLAHPGDSGTKVKALQQCLTHRGYTVTADGSFGPLTKSAVVKFQKHATPKDVDGIAGPKTLAALVVTVDSGARGSAVTAVQVCATHQCGIAYCSPTNYAKFWRFFHTVPLNCGPSEVT